MNMSGTKIKDIVHSGLLGFSRIYVVNIFRNYQTTVIPVVVVILQVTTQRNRPVPTVLTTFISTQ